MLWHVEWMPSARLWQVLPLQGYDKVWRTWQEKNKHVSYVDALTKVLYILRWQVYSTLLYIHTEINEVEEQVSEKQCQDITGNSEIASSILVVRMYVIINITHNPKPLSSTLVLCTDTHHVYSCMCTKTYKDMMQTHTCTHAHTFGEPFTLHLHMPYLLG